MILSKHKSVLPDLQNILIMLYILACNFQLPEADSGYISITSTQFSTRKNQIHSAIFLHIGVKLTNTVKMK